LKDTKGNYAEVGFNIHGNTQQNPQVCNHHFLPAKENTYQDEFISLVFKQGCFYDAFCFKSSQQASEQPYSYNYQVHYTDVPVHEYFNLKLKPKRPIPDSLHDKIALKRLPDGKEKEGDGQAAHVERDWVVSKVRSLGNYEIVIDRQAPTVKTRIQNNNQITNLQRLTFAATDETTAVKYFKADVDGQWLRMVQKGDLFYYEMDDHFPMGTHTLNIKVSDENDNVYTQKFQLTR
jgi:hypothetical protein